MPYSRESGFLQDMVEDGITFKDHDRDAVEKLRVSSPQNMIDTDFEYSLQASKWEFLNMCSNYPGVYTRDNEPAFTSTQISSITAIGSRDIVVNVNTLPVIPFRVGDSVVLKETADTTYVDGAYIITRVLSQLSFVVTTKAPAGALTKPDYKTQYTAVYTGGFYTNANIPIVGVSAIQGTKMAVIEFTQPHGLFITTPIIVTDSNQPLAPWCGSFTVSAVPSDTRVVFETLTGTNFSTSSLLVPSSGFVFGRTEGVAVHRFFDGGVQINPGTSAPDARIMRQTRKYFKYQSGKSVQFSTGVLFRPAYEVVNSYIDTSKFNNSTYPFYDFVMETEQYHGFAEPDLFREGVTIKTIGFTVTGTPIRNPYNDTFVVNKVLNSKTFSVQIPVDVSFNPFPTGDFRPGGIAKINVVGWNDATVRTGLFDDQNGLFFEYDGTQFWVVKRQTTTPLAGTVEVKRRSPWVVSRDNNTRFISQLKENDFISLKGMSYQVTSILNNVSALVTPVYRGVDGAGIKVIKTEELRVPQTEFNIDKLDGTGPSGYVVDLNKMQMMFMDYSWYGAGKVRFGIRGDKGKIIYFHEMYNNNVNDKAYMRSGNLPGRFEIQSKSQAGRLLTAVGTTGVTSISSLVSEEDARYLPAKGRIVADNEYIEYSKGTNLDGGVLLTFNNRNRGGLTTGPRVLPAGTYYKSFNQNCSPSLSHWGVAAIIDGGFNEDKSYLFTALSNTYLSATSAERALISVRLAPSVDYGITGLLGERNLINHSLLKLRSVGILCNNPLEITVRVNCEPQNIFRNLTAWKPSDNGSIAQYYDHTIDGSFEIQGTGGDKIAGFYITPDMPFNDFTNPRFTYQDFNVEVVREIGNSILGGDFVYPDGPDVVTIGVRTLNSYTAQARGRISWTEDQG